ncbi:MAG: SEC-C metal-binding domain-containing protein, partial [Patescibacteria group bacterium]
MVKLGRNDRCHCGSGKKYKRCHMDADKGQHSQTVQQNRKLVVNPKMFIHTPYIACPVCGKPDFGVLMINSGGYTRRCRSCWHDEHYS